MSEITIFKKEYHCFEGSFWDCYELEKDVEDCFDQRLNEAAKHLSGEFSGTVTVTITYKESDDETSSEG